MEGIVLIIVAAIFGLIIGLAIAAAFVLWGAKIAGIEQRTFGGAVVITILGGIASCVLTLILSVVPVLGSILGFIGSFFLYALIMMSIFKTTLGKSLAATVLAWILQFVVIGGIALAIFAAVGGLVALS